MHSFPFLDELMLMSTAALLVILLFRRMKLPPVIGLIVTGLMMGPSGLGLVENSEVISNAAEIGVVMLLFTIGLEFSLDELTKLRSIVLIGGPLQILLSSAMAAAAVLIFSAVRGFSISLEGAILVGMCTALSSTAICIKLLKESHQLQTSHGRAVLGILIFQDIAVVPMMIIATMLVSKNGIQYADIAYTLGVLVIVIAVLVVGLKWLLPRLMRFVQRETASEILILGGIVVCFGVAWITAAFGLSMALGAFIAGVAIAGSDEGHMIGEVIEPIRDVFTSLFFLSIGLLVNIMWHDIGTSIAVASIMVTVNALILIAIFKAIKLDMSTAIIASIMLSQVGEFSFVIASIGKEYQIISQTQYHHLLVSIIITMVVTPYLAKIAPKIAGRFAKAQTVSTS